MTTLNSALVKEIAEKHSLQWFDPSKTAVPLQECIESAVSEALSRARSVPEGETPRTDAEDFIIRWHGEEARYTVDIPNYNGGEVVSSKLARQLERELNAALSSRIPSGELGELLKEVERLHERPDGTDPYAITRYDYLVPILARELSSLRDSCEAQRVEIKELKMALEVEISERDYLTSQLGREFR